MALPVPCPMAKTFAFPRSGENTSTTAVDVFYRHYDSGKAKVFAIGQGTGKAILRHTGIFPLVSPEPNPRSLASVIEASPAARVLYPCSSLSNNPLHELEKVEPVPFYRVLPRRQDRLDLSAFAGIVFSSPSTAVSFKEIYSAFPMDMVYYAFGEATAVRLESFGLPKGLIIRMRL